MIYAGADYEVVTVFTTVYMSDGQYKRHLELYNKYACLVVDPLPQEEEQESMPILRKSFQVTAREIDQRYFQESMHINANVGKKAGRTFNLLKTDLINTQWSSHNPSIRWCKVIPLVLPRPSTKLLLSTQAKKESRTQEMVTSKVYDQMAVKRGSMSSKQPKERQHHQSYALLRRVPGWDWGLRVIQNVEAQKWDKAIGVYNSLDNQWTSLITCLYVLLPTSRKTQDSQTQRKM